VGGNIDTVKKNKEALLDAGKEVGLEVKAEKIKSRSKKIQQKHSRKIANRSFEDVAKFRYLGITLTDQNFTHEVINS
jgi:cytidylate kinase